MQTKILLFSLSKHATIAKQTNTAMKISEPESNAKPSPASADKQRVTVLEKLFEQNKIKRATNAIETWIAHEKMLLIPQKNTIQNAEKHTISSLVKRLWIPLSKIAWKAILKTYTKQTETKIETKQTTSFSAQEMHKYTFPAPLISVKTKHETRFIFFFKILNKSHNKTMQNAGGANKTRLSSDKLKTMFETKNETARNNPFFFKSNSAKAKEIENGLMMFKTQAFERIKKHKKSNAYSAITLLFFFKNSFNKAMLSFYQKKPFLVLRKLLQK